MENHKEFTAKNGIITYVNQLDECLERDAPERIVFPFSVIPPPPAAARSSFHRFLFSALEYPQLFVTSSSAPSLFPKVPKHYMTAAQLGDMSPPIMLSVQLKDATDIQFPNIIA